MVGVRSPVGYQGPALYVYRLPHFTRTPAIYSRIFHSRILYVFSPALPHFTNTHQKVLRWPLHVRNCLRWVVYISVMQ